MRPHCILLLLATASPLIAKEGPSQVHPKLKQLEHRIGDWEADITLRGLKVGKVQQSWSWGAGGNLIFSQWKTQLPFAPDFQEDGFSLIRVNGEDVVMETFIQTKGKGTEATYAKTVLNFTETTISWKSSDELFDELIEEHDDTTIVSLTTKRGDKVRTKLINWRRTKVATRKAAGDEVGNKTHDWSDFHVSRNITYANRDSGPLLLDAFIPKSEGPHAVVLTFRGGGEWRQKVTSDQLASAIASEFEVAIFSIDFRLAPTHRFPTQLRDCEDAVRWIRDNAKAYNVDAN